MDLTCWLWLCIPTAWPSPWNHTRLASCAFQYLTITHTFSSGPFEINGVPLRRVNQRYVIATSVKVDVASVKIPAEDDSYFAREDQAKKTAEDQFFDHASKVWIPLHAYADTCPRKLCTNHKLHVRDLQYAASRKVLSGSCLQ